MRTRSVSWFRISAQHERQAEDGLLVKVRKTYVVDAFTFGETENAIIKKVASYSSGEFVIKGITPAVYSEILFSDREADDKWCKAKLVFIAINEEKGRGECTAVGHLVQTKNVEGALQNIGEVFSSSVLNYVAANVSETKTTDVFEHDLKKEPDDQPGV